MEGNGICLTQDGACDGDRLAEFYFQVFDWEPSLPENALPHPACSGHDRALLTVPGRTPGYQTVYIDVTDADEAAARLVQLGARLLGDPVDLPDIGRLAMLRDPMGNTLGLIQPTADSTGG